MYIKAAVSKNQKEHRLSVPSNNLVKISMILILSIIVFIVVTSIYYISHVTPGTVAIPSWYKEKTAVPTPVLSFVSYWRSRAIQYGLMASGGFLVFSMGIFFTAMFVSRKNR